MTRHPWLPALAAVAAVALACGCKKKVATDGGERRDESSLAAVAYQLSCDAAETETRAQLYCTRIDTRTGDVLQVDLNRIPRSRGPTGAAEEPAGTYQLVCRSAGTADKSDYRCVRLNARTGELMLIDLNEVGVIPERR